MGNEKQVKKKQSAAGTGKVGKVKKSGPGILQLLKKSDKKPAEKKVAQKKPEKKKKKKEDSDEDSDEDDDDDEGTSASATKSITIVVPERKALPGACKTTKQPNNYYKQIVVEDRPDLGADDLNNQEAELLEKTMRDRADFEQKDFFYDFLETKDDDPYNYLRYQVVMKFNEGRYSSVYIVRKETGKEGKEEADTNLQVLKCALRHGSKSFDGKLKREVAVLKDLATVPNPRYPKLLKTVNSGIEMPFFVMNALDQNMEKMRETLGKKLRPATILYVALEIFVALTDMHSKEWVHRDVKPANMCTGVGSKSVYLIDFGESVKKGRKQSSGCADVNTLPYCSRENHKKKAQEATTKSDIESWFYFLYDFYDAKGLPWRCFLDEDEVDKAKNKFWDSTPGSLNEQLKKIYNLIKEAKGDVDYKAIKSCLQEEFSSAGGGKDFTPDWLGGGGKKGAKKAASGTSHTPVKSLMMKPKK